MGNCLSTNTISISGNNKFVNFAKSFNLMDKLIPIENLNINNVRSVKNIDRILLSEESEKIKTMIKNDINLLRNQTRMDKGKTNN